MSNPEQDLGVPKEPPANNAPTSKPATNLLSSSELSASASSLASNSSKVSVASSKISVATNKSGIRPPSKIGRLCGDKHKPAVPPSPPRSKESDDPLKRMFDDYGRHKLTVLEEDNEEEQYTRPRNGYWNRKRYSSSSPSTSMDALWELHPHRLSEAGLSRHSDSSAILTEDTDSFIIGQRVWVGGTKPGHIAFIGETQFAPGEWAGIALDEPIGKNDGSVGGIRYFMCEPKKGVFARLTRLTRFPLGQDLSGSGDTFVYNIPQNGSVRKSPFTPSPTESHRSMVKSPVSISGSNTSLASAHVDFKVGDRVIIKSSQGSKVGYVRFMGVTEFAPGEWVGVELDEPRGKNDGSVNGIRYFDCQPNFGLFSPISKVSKSPSKFKPSAQCQIHSPTGRMAPSVLKRAGSKESLNSNLSMFSSASATPRRVRLGVTSLTPKKVPSNTSSVPTRTALQDVLKEKQQHIEQLLKERDLERSEITRAANQADEAEHKLALLTQEYSKYRAECEAQLEEHIALLNELKKSRNELISQLEDEKKKNEDWEFKFEEAEITRADLEKDISSLNVLNESSTAKIKELEEALSTQMHKIQTLESENSKIQEADETIKKLNAEINNLKTELRETRNRHLALEGDSATTTVLIKSLQDDLDQSRKDVDEKSEMINVLKREISNFQTEQEALKSQIGSGESKLKIVNEQLSQKDLEIEEYKTNLENITKTLNEKIKAIEQLQAENLNVESGNEKTIEKLKMEISSKIVDIESLNDTLLSKEAFVADLKNQLEKSLVDLENRNRKLEETETILKTSQLEMDKTVQELKHKLEEQVKQRLEIEEKLLKETAKAEEEINKLKAVKEENDKIINELNESFISLKNSHELKVAELNESHNKQLDEVKDQFNAMFAKKEDFANQLKLEIEEKNGVIEELNGKLVENNKTIENLTKDLENAKISTSNEQKQLKDEVQKQIESLTLKINQLNSDLENKNSENNTLNERIKTLESNLEHKTNDFTSLNTQYETFKTKLEMELASKSLELQKSTEEITKNNNTIHILQLELQNTKSDLETASNDLIQYQTNLSDVEVKLKKERDELHEEVKNKVNDCDNLRKELQDVIAINDKTVSDLEKDIKEKSQFLEKLNADLLKQKEVFEEMIRELIEKHNKEISENDAKLLESKDIIKKMEDEIANLSKQLAELDKSVNERTLQLTQLNSQLQENLEQKNRDWDQINELKTAVATLTTVRTELETETKKVEDLQSILQNTEKNFELELKRKNEELTEKLNALTAQEQECSNLNLELINFKLEHEKLTQEIAQYKNNFSDVEHHLTQERDELKQQYITKCAEFEKSETRVVELDQELKSKINVTETITTELNLLKSELQTKNNELDDIKKQLALVNTNIEEKLNDETVLKRQLDEVKSELSSKSTELIVIQTDLQKMIKDLEQQLTEAHNLVAQKTDALHFKEDEISQITENQKKFITELMEDHKTKLLDHKKNNEEWESKLNNKTDEINQLNVNIKELKNVLTSKEDELMKLKEQLSTSQTELSSNASEQTIKMDKLEKEKQECKNIMEMLQIEVEQLQKERENLHKQIQEYSNANSLQINELEKKLVEKDGIINSIQLDVDKRHAENEKLIKEQSEKLNSKESSENVLRDLVADMQTKLKEYENLNSNFNNLQVEITKKDVAIANKDAEIMKLKEQLSKMGTSKVSNGQPSDSVLLEEKIFAENQVAFLNSIIVDMQKKNEEQKAKIEILEMGYSPAAAEELRQLGFKSDFQRQPAPRVYCDICEEFDLHETEDCPTQSSEPISNSQLGKKKKEKPPPREYCEICGEFGHDTANCTDDQEF